MNETHLIARSALREWEQSKPKNFFTADLNFQNVLRKYFTPQSYNKIESKLQEVGRDVATKMEPLAREEDQIGNLPYLNRWTPIGDRIEEIKFHPNHFALGKLIWKTDILVFQSEPGNTLQQMALFYLLSHIGEAGQLCSLGCTSGLIRALQVAGSRELCVKYLHRLFDTNYDTKLHATEFLSEIQGGSDVGANSLKAKPLSNGVWLISGEKWFCSNTNADLIMITARPEGGPSGTKGLGLFLLPRVLDDGTTNRFFIRRLKDKIGTRCLASAELDFDNAIAYQIGEIDKGFQIVVSDVLNTARYMLSILLTGMLRRAYIEAETFTMHRKAFGKLISEYPLVQEALADIKSEYYAMMASNFYTVHLLDKIDTKNATKDESNVYRLFLNVNKYASSIRTTEMMHRSMEVLGGNGAIETFSVLPRFYRDLMVFENWEGTHNTLCLQVLRDDAKLNLHDSYDREMRSLLKSIIHPKLQKSKEFTENELDKSLGTVKKLAGEGAQFAEAHARRFVNQVCNVMHCVLLLSEAQFELENNLKTDKPDIITYYINRHIKHNYDPMEDKYYITRLSKCVKSAQIKANL